MVRQVKGLRTSQTDIEAGKRIRLRRLELKMSQTELGERLGVTFQQVQKYEKGTNRVAAGRLAEIATVLEVPLSFFFPDSGLRTKFATTLLLNDTLGVRLVRAFSRLKGRKIRQQIVVLLEELVGLSSK